MKVETLKKIQSACNKLVYQWKREYNKCIKNNKPIPKQISIPQIAERAGIAPKTIYTNEKYKKIALIAIAKTEVCSREEDLEFYEDKEMFNKEEVKLILKSVREKYEVTIRNLTQTIIDNDKSNIKVNVDIRDLEELLKKYAQRIVEIESENARLVGIINLLNKNNLK